VKRRLIAPPGRFPPLRSSRSTTTPLGGTAPRSAPPSRPPFRSAVYSQFYSEYDRYA